MAHVQHCAIIPAVAQSGQSQPVKTSVLGVFGPRIEKFQSGLVVSVGTDVSRPDHPASQSALRIVRLKEAKGLSRSEWRFCHDPGPVFRQIHRCPVLRDLLALRFDHEDDGSSDWFAFRPPGNGAIITCHAEEGIQEIPGWQVIFAPAKHLL